MRHVCHATLGTLAMGIKTGVPNVPQDDTLVPRAQIVNSVMRASSPVPRVQLHARRVRKGGTHPGQAIQDAHRAMLVLMLAQVGGVSASTAVRGHMRHPTGLGVRIVP